MTIYVGSLKSTPVFKSHCFAFGKACEKRGSSVKYLLSSDYNWLLSDEEKAKSEFVGHSTSISSMLADASSIRNRKKISRIFAGDKPSHIYMHNYHLLNHFIAGISRKYGCTFIYHVHEPYVKNKGRHGGFHQYWLHLFEYLQGRLLRNTDVAVVSSKMASNLFDLRYPDFSGKKMFVPLMYEDLGGPDSAVLKREFVTFIGTPVPAKSPEKFLEIIKYSRNNRLGLKFLLISPSKISDRKYFEEPNLEVRCGGRLSDEEFGNLVRSSITVVTPYRRETQSSTILVSYMYGTPVVSSNVGGLPEFVSHKETGYLLDVDAEVDEWIEGISYVQKNFERLSKNCREYFVENFSERNWGSYLDDLLI
jgi:glycosyltransferase involved in cell wall biosynthesis